jgi:hypothetical protein
VAQRHRVLACVAWAAGVLGWLVLAGAVWRSARYRPDWFDPDNGPPCAPAGDCSPADAAAGLTRMWSWVGVRGALVLAATVLTVLALPTVRAARPARPLPALPHAAVAGAAAGLPALFALLFGAHAIPAVLLGAWLGQAALLAAVDAALGAPATSPRRAALTGLAVSAVATGLVLAALGAGWAHLGDWRSLAAADGVLVALGVAVARLTVEAAPPAQPGPRAGRGAALVALALGAFLLLGGGGVLLRAAVGLLLAGDPPLPDTPAVIVPPPAPSPSAVPLPAAPVTTRRHRRSRPTSGAHRRASTSPSSASTPRWGPGRPACRPATPVTSPAGWRACPW